MIFLKLQILLVYSSSAVDIKNYFRDYFASSAGELQYTHVQRTKLHNFETVIINLIRSLL